MGATSHSKLGKSRHHLPEYEKTTGDNRGKGPANGSWHGKNSGSFHTRENVDLIQSKYTNHRHTENFVELDRLPTSASNDSWSNCRSLCAEKTNNQTSQPMKTKHRNNHLRTGKENFLYLPISSGWRNILFVGEMLEEQVGKPTWMIADLVNQLTS